MRFFFMLVRRVPPVPSPVLAEAFDILRGRGHDVDGAIAEEQARRADLLEPEHDLYVLKSHTQLSLGLAGALHAAGARVLNPYPSCARTMNKIVAARVLRAAGIPVPATWALGDPSELEQAVTRGPLVLKPYDGHRGAGVQVVRDTSELAAAVAERTDGPLLVQEHVRGTGEDLKVYVIGDLVFAVRKPFSSTSFSVPGRPVTVTDDVREIALGCGAALGLGLYGLDVIESPGGPVVVDVNYFPGYKGVPGAAPLLADYVEAYAHGAVPDLIADHVGVA